MKKALFLLSILFFVSFAFSVDVGLVNYYAGTVNSHACKSGDGSCAYANEIYIDSTYASDCSSGTRVLGLSGTTNAHVETKDYSYYDTNICMKSDIFTSTTCYYVAGSECNSGYNCVFGLSDFYNAHLSSCGVFGSSEVKFCCKSGVVVLPPVIPPAPVGGCNLYFAEIKDATSNQPINLSFACKTQEDVNLYFFTKQGDLISGPSDNLALRNVICKSSGTSFSDMNFSVVDNITIFMVRVVGKDCSIDTFFKVSPQSAQTIPDSTPIVALIVCIIVISIIFKPKKD